MNAGPEYRRHAEATAAKWAEHQRDIAAMRAAMIQALSTDTTSSTDQQEEPPCPHD